MYIAVLNISESGYAVFCSVDGKICVMGIFLYKGFQNAAGRGEETRTTVFVFFGRVAFKLNILGFQPRRQLVKGEYSVYNAFIILCLVLLCNAPIKTVFASG